MYEGRIIILIGSQDVQKVHCETMLIVVGIMVLIEYRLV